jgi:hypothetical protein
MAKPITRGMLAIALGCAAGAVAAQMNAPSIVSALPNVSSISPANAAGVLKYCMSHQLVSSAVTDAVVQPLTSTKGVTNSPDYTAGAAGKILTGSKNFSVAQAPGYLQSRACDMVLTRAKQFK